MLTGHFSNEIESLAIKETLQRRLPLPMDHLYQDTFNEHQHNQVLIEEEIPFDGDALLV